MTKRASIQRLYEAAEALRPMAEACRLLGHAAHSMSHYEIELRKHRAVAKAAKNVNEAFLVQGSCSLEQWQSLRESLSALESDE